MALALLPLVAVTTTQSLTAAVAQTSGEASIDASKDKVRYRGELTLRGAFADAGDQPVAIEQRRKRSRTWLPIAETQTDADGVYSADVNPRRSGDWRARVVTEDEAAEPTATTAAAAETAGTAEHETEAERVKVRSRTRAKVRGRHLTVGRTAKVKGRVLPAGPKRRVVVEVGGRSVKTKTDRDGSFAVRWDARGTGTYKVRVKARGNRTAAASRDRAGSVTVYRPAAASWYGPGMYGNGTACGGTLTPSTLGVAHKTMSCGTKVKLRYRGRSVKVPVIDRGPFAGDREFDLTAATRSKLGFPDVGTVLSSK